MERSRIEVVVSKNSGGPATYAKIEAARRLSLPVVMIERPLKPGGQGLADAPHALHWLMSQENPHVSPVSERGV